MTFIAMISMEDCVVLAADRRTFSIYTSGLTEPSEASARKITETSSGFITASGLVELIDPVKDRFKRESPEEIGNMLTIIKEEQQRLYLRDSIFAQEWIPKSTWKLSFLTSQGVTAAFYNPATHQLEGVFPGLTMITFPSEVPLHEQAYVNALFPRGVLLKPSQNTIQNAIEQVLTAVQYLRRCGRSVSREIDFAIHWADNRNQMEKMAL